jgi:hypothetical protein
MSESKKITLKSSDGETFVVEEAVAVESQTIKHMIEDDCAENDIPLPNVTSKILAKVIEYCKKHVEADADKDATITGKDEFMKSWDAEFVKVDKNTLFDLILVRLSVSFFQDFFLNLLFVNIYDFAIVWVSICFLLVKDRIFLLFRV